MKKNLVVFLVIVLLLAACSNTEIAPTLAISPIPSPIAHLPPTFTPPNPDDRFFATIPAVTVTQPTIVAQSTDTPVAFGETAVEVRYQIPSLGLDRRMQGSVSSQLVLADEVTGNIVKRSNQAGVILELQQILPDLLLPVVPEGCDSCVFISYDLPFADLQAEGWLRDPVLLASLENFLAVSVGPHFPAGTVAGLRRSASPYAPAHTIALTEDGLVYLWLATEPEVGEPLLADPALLAALQAIPAADLSTEYSTTCSVVPLETLFLKLEEGEGSIDIVCPEYTLPSILLPLYGQFDALLADKLAESGEAIERPPAGFPLTAVLDYERVDGAKLTIFQDGTAVATDASGTEVSTTISTTQVVSLTTELISSGIVRTGLNTFDLGTTAAVSGTVEVPATPKPPRTRLIVRGPGGVYDAEWFNTFEVPELLALNELLAQFIETTPTPEAAETPELSETLTPDPEATSTGGAETTATPRPSATPTLRPSATP